MKSEFIYTTFLEWNLSGSRVPNELNADTTVGNLMLRMVTVNIIPFDGLLCETGLFSWPRLSQLKPSFSLS